MISKLNEIVKQFRLSHKPHGVGLSREGDHIINNNLLYCIPGWSITAGGRRISLPTEAYPPATFPKAYMVNLRLNPPKHNKTYAAGVYYCISLDNLERGNGAVCSLY